MKYFYKLLCATALVVLCVSTSGCLTDPNICSAAFVNEQTTRLSLEVDNELVYCENLMPDDVWIKLHLRDGTVHTWHAWATDKRVYNKSGTFKVTMGHTEPYDIHTVNEVVHIR